MIVLQISNSDDALKKPVLCPKCQRGRLGNIPEESEAVISRRGKPPPGQQSGCVQIKCPVCRALWSVTIE